MHRRILLVGSSLALQSIGAALADIEEVECRTAPLGDGSTSLGSDEFTPDTVLFDVTAGVPDSALTCLTENKDLLLLGFNLETHQVLVLSGEPARLSTTEDLRQILMAAPRSAA